VRQAEIRVLAAINDWIIYAVDPDVYARQPFLGWDTGELLEMADFGGKLVIDVGPGTGRQAFAVARLASVVWAVEPSGNLRDYLRARSRELGMNNVYLVDGLMTELPFPDRFADIVMSGHVYGDEPEAELAEMLRVTKTGGDVLLIPGNNDVDNPAHAHLVANGFEWARFEEPGDGTKRKYWRKR
jgi:ubiquinone/menaquinone biosynthesis C-methylase UbiE